MAGQPQGGFGNGCSYTSYVHYGLIVVKFVRDRSRWPSALNTDCVMSLMAMHIYLRSRHPSALMV